MSKLLDFSELDRLDKDLLRLANKSMPKECKTFVRSEGTKLKKVVTKKARSQVKKRTGNYVKGIKRGKVYKYKGNGAWAIRVYGAAAHTHLIEHGYRQIVNGKEIGFTEGKHIFDSSTKEFENTYVSDVGKFVDRVIVGGLKK